MELFIKNMVCNRCILVVSQIFSQAKISTIKVQLGRVTLSAPIPNDQLAKIEKELNDAGFELITDAKSRLIEQVNKLAISYVYDDPGKRKENFSNYLSSHLHHDYNYLSSLYSSVEGTTIEKHLINLKVERVKELLVYDEKTLSEIAYELDYSSAAHLSGQFKRVTGFTPSYFKKLGEKKRKSLDRV